MLPPADNTINIPYICRLMYEAYRIPVFWLDEAGSILLALPEAPVLRPDSGAAGVLSGVLAGVTGVAAGSGIPGTEPDLPDSGTAQDSAPAAPLPAVLTTRQAENFIVLGLSEGGCLVAGPSLGSSMREEHTALVLGDLGIPASRREEWLHYYRQLPVVEWNRLYHAAMLLYTLVTGKALSVSELLLDRARIAASLPPASQSPDLDLSFRRENTWLHHEPALENELFRHVRSGDSEGLLHSMSAFSEMNSGLLSKKSRLRSQKNLAISSITLATRAAIAGGLFWEIAYTLSDFHIQHIEELPDLKAVENAQLAALCDFADHVRDSRRSKSSRPSALCQNYIFNHLYEDITLDRLAKAAGLHPSYLSQLFKQENGMTISDYIQRERIEEAKRLLELPGINLSDIATRLRFNDQSYFTKVFKKFTGKTPRQFRQQWGDTE
ncbi:helix-turn-helix domain-containing protein [Paenibacillus sp. PK3_47]|uniref:helix-turn-helix domain-containing protein n=1 Tax=Paenibacillus sp. PK3_47 TaxID=2072642 RepID=UPI00201D562D|nr:helix-turn-helix domain-containing protein [Paenibacillus sp. PK3_47]